MPIATTAAIGLGLTAATTGFSFAQASKQRKLQKEAENGAANAMQEARKKLEVNFYKGLGIAKEPYQIERDALISAGAQSIQAGVESERGAASVAGQIQMAQNQGQRNIASAMGNDIMGLNKLVATEEGRLRDIGVGLDLGTVEGAQLAARNNNMLANQSFMQGMEGVTSLAGQVAKLPALYPNTGVNPAEQAYKTAVSTNALDPKFTTNGTPMSYAEALLASGMNEADFLKLLTTQQKEIGLKNYKFPVSDNSIDGY